MNKRIKFNKLDKKSPISFRNIRNNKRIIDLLKLTNSHMLRAIWLEQYTENFKHDSNILENIKK